MTDNMHPTNRNWCLFDPALHPPPKGVNLLLINEGGVLIVGPWYKGALAWGYKPVIPASVKERLSKEQQQKAKDETERQSGKVDPR